MGTPSTVFVVEDNESVRCSLTALLQDASVRVESFSSAEDFLTHHNPHQPGCLLIDLRLPGMSGQELYRKLRQTDMNRPFIVLTAYGDIQMAVSAFREGAFDFLEKPCDNRYLLQRVRAALEKDQSDRAKRQATVRASRLYASLTPREKEVANLVAAGLLTKQIAKRLAIRENTVEVHRSHIMKKMHVESVAQLVRVLLELPDQP